jgi:hypothetical protein
VFGGDPPHAVHAATDSSKGIDMQRSQHAATSVPVCEGRPRRHTTAAVSGVQARAGDHAERRGGGGAGGRLLLAGAPVWLALCTNPAGQITSCEELLLPAHMPATVRFPRLYGPGATNACCAAPTRTTKTPARKCAHIQSGGSHPVGGPPIPASLVLGRASLVPLAHRHLCSTHY